MSTEIEAQASMLVESTDGTKMTRAQALATVLWQKALSGDLEAAKMIYDRTEGRPTTPIEHAGDGGGPIEFIVRTIPDGVEDQPTNGHGDQADPEAE